MKQRNLLIALALSLAAGSGEAALANSYKVNPPPVVLSPNLAEPWINQLQPGYRYRRPETRRKRNWWDPSGGRRNRAIGTHRSPATDPTPASTPPQRQIAPQFLPTVVDWDGGQAPGTIVIDTSARHLYLVEPGGRARRYGVGVGKEGFQWSGTERISRKAEWPDWRPPAEMIARERRRGRHLPAYMPGGPNNPLGARALYLGGSLYRIHGSNQPWTIGHAVSSGCIRMRNEDVSDLYERVGVGTKVVVL